MRQAGLASEWLKHFAVVLDETDCPPNIKDGAWTTLLGDMLERVGEGMGCYVVRNRKSRSGKRRHPDTGEHLGIDVMFFDAKEYDSQPVNKYGKDPLIRPKAAIELENDDSFDKIAYCLWKVLCVRAPLKVLICYQTGLHHVRALRKHLKDVMEKGRLATGDKAEVLVLVGDEAQLESAEWGEYFTVWTWSGSDWDAIRLA